MSNLAKMKLSTILKITLALVALVSVFATQPASAEIPEGTRTEVTSSGARSWIVRMDASDEWAFCMEITDSAPRIGDDYNVIAGSNTNEGSTSRNRIAAAMNVLSDSDFTSRYTEDQITDGLNRAIWAYTDGHNSSNTIAQAIRDRVSDGRYQPMDITFYRHANDPGRYQDMVSITPETGSIGDTIWYDNNGDGVQNGDEEAKGISGVSVQLELPDGTTIVTDTDSNGNYLFEDLPDGDYTVTVIGAPESATNTGDPDGGGDNTSQVTITNGSDDLDQDFGYQRLGAIGDTVWLDINGNGIQDSEEGISGVTVLLLDEDGEVIDTRTTDGNGRYFFDDLPTGTYTVEVVEATLPDGVVQTYDADGLATANESVYTLAPGETNREQDFGYQPLGAIGDTVWFDDDADGTQNGDEAGIAGVIVQLIQGGTVLAEDVTDQDGKYLFDQLPVGSYTVEVVEDTLPAGIQQTYDADGLGSPNVSVYDLGISETNLDQDFGYVTLLSVGDTVWYDADGDGIQAGTAAEAGIDGVTVQLVQGGAVIATDVTEGGGLYLFDGLEAGTYEIVIPAQDGDGEPLQGLANTVGSADPDTSSANNDDNGIVVADGSGDVTSEAFALEYTGEPTDEDGDPNSDLTIDFGYYPLLAVGDTVWYDADGDGIQAGTDAEAGIDGVTVQLVQDGAVIATDVTEGGGLYLFDGLQAGTYEIVIPAQDGDGEPLRGLANTVGSADPDASSANDDDNGVVVADGSGDVTSEAFVLEYSGEPTAEDGDANSDLTIDFGYYPLLAVGDTVWFDADKDGIQAGTDAEYGIDGVTVELWKDGALFATEVTEGGGLYLFDGLQAGMYQIIIPAQSGIGEPLAGLVNTTGDADPDASPETIADPLNDDNGVPELANGAGAVVSEEFALEYNGEPTYDIDGDANSDLTIDFGFHPVTITVAD